MKTTIDERGNIVYVRREFFAEDQTCAEENEDYVALLDSLKACRTGDCTVCILCDFHMNGGESCTDVLLRIAEDRISKLRFG